MGEEEELYFGWGRRPWRRDKIVSGGKERFLIGMGEETGGWEKSEGKKKKKIVRETCGYDVRKFTK